jgi:large subunit ribosomal protein L10
MNKAEKTATIEVLKEQFGENNYFYLADASTMSVGDVNKFRNKTEFILSNNFFKTHIN